MKFKYGDYLKHLILVFCLFLVGKVYSQDSTFAISYDDKDRIIVEGLISIPEWFSVTGNSSSDITYYIYETEITDRIKDSIANNDYSFIIVAGSWCGDTKTELPKILSVLKAADTNEEKIIIIGVGRDKVIKFSEKFNYMIDFVPTLIIEKSGTEIGRIVEFPIISWEEDVLKILQEK